jgi:hypothetical protein
VGSGESYDEHEKSRGEAAAGKDGRVLHKVFASVMLK